MKHCILFHVDRYSAKTEAFRLLVNSIDYFLSDPCPGIDMASMPKDILFSTNDSEVGDLIHTIKDVTGHAWSSIEKRLIIGDVSKFCADKNVVISQIISFSADTPDVDGCEIISVSRSLKKKKI